MTNRFVHNLLAYAPIKSFTSVSIMAVLIVNGVHATDAFGPNQQAVQSGILVPCVTGANGTSNPNASAANNRFQLDCNAIAGGSGSSLAEALGAITTDDIAGIETNMVTSSVSAVFGRLSALRLARSGFANRSYAGLGLDPRGGAAGADEIFGRLGFFINGSYSWQDHNENSFEPGFEFEERKIMTGVDYRLTDDMILGVSAGWVDSDTDIDSNAGNIETVGYNIALYGSYYPTEELYVDFIGGYGGKEHDIHRNIQYSIPGAGPAGTVNNRANSDPDSDNYFATVGTGYQLNMAQFGVPSLIVTPMLRFDYVRLELDSYTEKMSDANTTTPGSSWNLRVTGEEFDSLTSNLGVQADYAWSQSWGVVMPFVSGEWVHQYKDSSETINARFVNDITGLGVFSVKTNSPDRNWFNFRIGASAQFAHGIAAFVNFEKIFGLTNVNADTLYVGLRMELQ